ncbi:MAG: hypothetical protein ABSG00_05545 [Terracidiphilus sp.]
MRWKHSAVEETVIGIALLELRLAALEAAQPSDRPVAQSSSE